MNWKNRASEFVGGQIEIQNPAEGYVYRGEIGTIAVEEGQLRVTFNWRAKGMGLPPMGWVGDDKRYYEVGLAQCNAADGYDRRVVWYLPASNEIVVLFPENGSRLDPAKVQGLDAKVE